MYNNPRWLWDQRAHHLFQDSMFLWLKIILTLAVYLCSQSRCTTNSGPIKSLLNGIQSWIQFCLYLLGLRRPLLITKTSDPSVENQTYKNLCHASLLPGDTQSHRQPFSKGNSLPNAPGLEHLLPSFLPGPCFLYIPNLLAFAHTLNQGKFSINTYFWQVLTSLQMGLTRPPLIIFLLFSWHCWKLALSIAWVFLLLHNSRYFK